MAATILTRDEIANRGREMYDRDIRPVVEPIHNGKMLVVNVGTGEYEMDMDPVAAVTRASARFGDASLLTFRVGHLAAYRLGSGVKVRQS